MDRTEEGQHRVQGRRLPGLIWNVAIALLAFAIGVRVGGPAEGEPPLDLPEAADAREPTVTGIGGVFFRSADPARLAAWYRTHLGLAIEPWGGSVFYWEERGRPEEVGYTVWHPYPDTTTRFPPHAPLMVNLRVRGLRPLVADLASAGVEVDGEIEEHPNGLFAWIVDPEGHRVELWEPVPSHEDPYLRAESGGG